MALSYLQYKTPVGTLQLLADGDLLLAANFSHLKALKESLQARGNSQEIKSVKRISVITDLLENYFDGELNALNGIKTSQPGGPFSQAAWKAMRKIAPGKVLSYSDLAARAGSPEAVRAAGSACAKNAIVLVVPCHRIVKTGGALGNYAYGVKMKEWFLRHEGAL